MQSKKDHVLFEIVVLNSFDVVVVLGFSDGDVLQRRSGFVFVGHVTEDLNTTQLFNYFSNK